MTELTTPTQHDISLLIGRHLTELRRPGVLTARPGYLMQNGWITDTPAIVLTVESASSDQALPTEIQGVPVDVRVASPAKMLRLTNPRAYSRSTSLLPDNGAVPEFADERMFVGQPLRHHRAPTAPTDTALADLAEPTDAVPATPTAAPDTALSELILPSAAPPKPSLPYTAPPGVALTPVTGRITLHLTASPDSGWPTLKSFLEATEHTLTVGLYDFTSAHILAAVQTALAGRAVKLTLDHPARNPTADQNDEQTVAALKAALAPNLEQAWALERMDPLAAAYIYPSAYHIKVAVRDSSALWLSSGNWNNSNQPDIDPVSTPADATEARIRDRDWHVVIEHPELAATFGAYLEHDLAVALEHQRTPAQALEQSLAQATADAPAQAEAFDARATDHPALVVETVQTPPFGRFFAATTITDDVTITPLLTPDPGVYSGAVRDLILSATTSLHMQFQYIELPKTASVATAAFAALVDAVIDRQKAGVDVQIIMSQYETVGYLEQLQAAGLDVVNRVKLQGNVHNKGIIIDGRRTLISSQNWSSAGTLFNRDAGVIIDSAPVAAYFAQIFAHDWTTLAHQKAAVD